MRYNYNLAILFTGAAIGHAINTNWLGVTLMSGLVLMNAGLHLLLVNKGIVK